MHSVCDGLNRHLINGELWPQASPNFARYLAVKLAAAPGTPADHALAAFFLLCDDEAEKAKEHLRKAKDKGAEVRAAFDIDR